VLLGQKGGGGQLDTGYGYMIAADRWNARPGALRVWSFEEDPLQGTVVYHDAHFGTAGTAPSARERAAGGPSLAAVRLRGQRHPDPRQPLERDRLLPLDDSGEVLVVAQVMTDLNAGGGVLRSAKQPTGMLDVTGGYFLWTSNMGGRGSDAFLVKVPSQRLTGTVSEVLFPLPPRAGAGVRLDRQPGRPGRAHAALAVALPNPGLLR